MKYHSQSGSALIISLILLIALSVMAISSMNTATLDLLMAGNEQYRARAFSTAEAGIQKAIISSDFDLAGPTTPFQSSITYTNLGSDRFKYKISNESKGAIEPPPAGYSEGQYGAVYYRITATGYSERSSTAVVNQDLYEVVRNPNDISYSSKVCASTTSLNSSC